MSKVSRVVATRSFESSLKQLKKKHEVSAIDELYQTVLDLMEFKITKQKSNHALKNAEGHIDLHLKSGKLVLLYRYDDDETLHIALRLQDIVNHDQLARYDKWKAPAREFDFKTIKGSTSFDSWYDSLPEEEQWKVDDIADRAAIPFYDEASDDELSWLMTQYTATAKEN